MDTTFIRKDFYVEPPRKDASPEVWDIWLKLDEKKASAAKRAFTSSQKAEECDNPQLSQMGMVKLGGVWRQSPMLFSGSAETGLIREIAVEATQEKELECKVYALEDYAHRRGNSRKNRNRNRRAKRNARRKARFV